MSLITKDPFALDLETKSLDSNNPQFALEAFRVAQNRATVTDIAVSGPEGYSLHSEQMTDLYDILDDLKGQVVYAHNALFDVAWCIAHCGIDVVKKIHWRDTQLLEKWLTNSQATEYAKGAGYSRALVGLVKRYMMDHPDAEAFVKMKEQGEDVIAGENPEYWSRRAIADAEFCRLLAVKLENMMPDDMRAGYIIEQATLVPVANSFLVGLRLDGQGAEAIKPRIARAKAGITEQLGIAPTVISSPSQLSNYLFNTCGMPPVSRSAKTGKPSTSKDDLKILHHNLISSGNIDDATTLKRVLDFKQLNTLESKYINGIERVLAYTHDGKSHGSPRLFGTYTGRFTYSSQTKRKKLHQVGIAQHQVPRKGPTKSLIKANEGYDLLEVDASGQESRIMAIMSGDEAMIDVFQRGMDFHSMTGSSILGRAYEEFVAAFHSEEISGIPGETTNGRYNGKFVNLSCNYRIGDAALKKKAFTQYGIIVNHTTASSWNRTFKSSYPGVPAYWKSSIAEAKLNGYARTLAGRRYGLTNWSGNSWVTESSAINLPIQGGGGDMKYLAIKTIFEKFPEAIYTLDVHDANFYQLEQNGHQKELALEIKACLNNIDYNEAWNVELPIPLLWDAKIGPSWKELREIT